MIIFHNMSDDKKNLDFSNATAKHSGDKIFSYKNVNGEDILLSCYFPCNYDSSKKYPSFIFVHGGGWSSEKIFDDQNGIWQGDYLGYLARYYADKGFVSFSINYRLIERNIPGYEYEIADCFDDCCDAIDFILDSAENFCIDKNNVFILGESAGGHLAALLSTSYKRDGFKFKAAFPINAILDFTNDSFWIEKIPEKSSNPMCKSFSRAQCAEYLSPHCCADYNTCPTLMIHGNNDACVQIKHSENYHEKLLKLGVPCELHIIRHAYHAFLLAEYTDIIDACKIGIGIIDDYLKKIVLP